MVAAGSRVLEAQRLIFVRDAGKPYHGRRSSRRAMSAVNVAHEGDDQQRMWVPLSLVTAGRKYRKRGGYGLEMTPLLFWGN